MMLPLGAYGAPYNLIFIFKFSLDDPRRITIDMSSTRHWATGDYQVEVDNEDIISDVMYLIKQSYNNK